MEPKISYVAKMEKYVVCTIINKHCRRWKKNLENFQILILNTGAFNLQPVFQKSVEKWFQKSGSANSIFFLANHFSRTRKKGVYTINPPCFLVNHLSRTTFFEPFFSNHLEKWLQIKWLKPCPFSQTNHINDPSNVCSTKKLTKHSSSIVLRLVSFTAEQTLKGFLVIPIISLAKNPSRRIINVI